MKPDHSKQNMPIEQAFCGTQSEILRHGIVAYGFVLFFIASLAVLWGFWFFTGKITLYEFSQKAEVEIVGGAVPLQVQIAGQLTQIFLEPGKPCLASQVIAVLDSGHQELALQQAQTDLKEAELSSELASKQNFNQAKLALLTRRVEERTHELRQTTLSCPVPGLIADRDPSLRPGSWVEARQRIGTLFPSQKLHGIAYFNPATALGRLREPQDLTFRLDALPWTQYGSLKGKITQVDRSKKDGYIRAEFDFEIPVGFRGRIEPGLTGQVEVAVEQVTPASIVFRSAGAVKP